MTIALGLALGLVLALLEHVAQVAQAGPAPPSTLFTVGRPASTRPIPPGFLGLSLEYFAIPALAGTDPQNVDPVFVQLIRNLAGDAPPELRIGGDTTDLTWWPIPGMRTPAGVNQTLTPDWIAIARALATATGARLTLGINLEADSATVASTEADQLAAGLGTSNIEAFELGNEPELYGTFTWGHSGKPGRPRNYDFAAFSRDYTRIARALGDVPLAGPATGGPRWFADIGRFLKDHRDVAVATVHRYPLESCYVKRHDPTYPTIPHLLSEASTQELATSVGGAVSQAHAHHVPIRVDEINTVSCGWDPATGRSFASALWALQTLFDLADLGVDGVNIHTFPGATYELFRLGDTNGQWHGTVFPEYYGLDLFAQAAPAGSRPLTVSPGETGTNRNVQTFATRATDGTIRVVVINEGGGERKIEVRARTSPPTATTGTLELLTAPSLGARSGVTLAGQSFGQSTTTGLLAGARKTIAVKRAHGEYTLNVPAATAALLTLSSS